MNFIEILESFGIKVPLIISGAAGGLASIGRNTKISYMGRFLSIVSGAFSSNYLGPVVADWMSMKENTILGLSFLVGYGGLKFVEIAYQKVTTVLPSANNVEVVELQIISDENRDIDSEL